MAEENRFAAGKALTHNKAEIQAKVAAVVRVFKAGGIVDEGDLEYIAQQVTHMKETVIFHNDKLRRERREPVKTK